MINAGEVGGVAIRIAADARAAMGALVYDSVELALFITGDYNWRVSDSGSLEIAGVRHFGFETGIIPS
jgi:hypothetical protein